MAKGSAAEVSSMAILGGDLQYIGSSTVESIENEAIAIMKMIAVLISKLETRNQKPETRA